MMLCYVVMLLLMKKNHNERENFTIRPVSILLRDLKHGRLPSFPDFGISAKSVSYSQKSFGGVSYAESSTTNRRGIDALHDEVRPEPLYLPHCPSCAEAHFANMLGKKQAKR